ncbi:putative MFS-type transporter [Rhodotorula toruloides]|nr:putative MFS-type transporter [Rhodotorula toruloides]
MAFGILEPKNVSNPLDVLGTAALEETQTTESDVFSKHAPGRPDLILVPTPSDDPLDPLKWSRFRKEAAYAVLLLGTCLAGTCGPLVAPAFVEMSQQLGRPLSQIATGLNGKASCSRHDAASQVDNLLQTSTGSLVFAIGVGSCIFAPIQTKWGTRPSFLIASVVAFVSQIWAGASGTNFPSLCAARVLQGLAMGCWFNGAPSAIAAITFVHERGFRIALWNLGLVGGINLGPVISAQICQRQGWHFAFWWQSLAAGLVLLGTIFLVPEMEYDRSYYYAELERRREMLTTGSGSPSEEKYAPEQKEVVLGKVVTAPQDIERATPSRWTQYRFSTGSKTDVSFLTLFLRPFYYFISPTIIWASLTFSVCFNLLPLAATVYAQVFGAPPYNLTVGGIGLVGGIPPLIGTLIGTFATGPLSDMSAKYLSKRNNGIYEPEFRLLPMILFLVFGGMGFYGWGLQQSSSWIVPAIFIAILHIGVSAATISCISYVTDSLRDGAADGLGLVVFIKSSIGFGITFIINDWYAARGPRQFFVSLGSLVVTTSGLAIPAWIFGKKARHWFSQHNLLA